MYDPDGPNCEPAEVPMVAIEAGTPLDVSERQQIEAALERFGGNRAAAAASLGISIRSLQLKLRDYRLADAQKLRLGNGRSGDINTDHGDCRPARADQSHL